MIVEFSHHPTRMFAVLFYYSGLILNFYFMEKDDTANYCKKKISKSIFLLHPIFFKVFQSPQEDIALYTQSV